MDPSMDPGAEPQDRVWDRGLQLERTSLAWTRSALAMLAAGALVVRLLATRDQPAVALSCAAVLVVMAAAVLLLAARRYRHADAALREGGLLPDGRVVALLTAATGVLGAGGLYGVLAG